MRRVGQALSVEAMSLYKHVSGKEDILGGISDLVMLEVEVPARDLLWRNDFHTSPPPSEETPQTQQNPDRTFTIRRVYLGTEART